MKRPARTRGSVLERAAAFERSWWFVDAATIMTLLLWTTKDHRPRALPIVVFFSSVLVTAGVHALSRLAHTLFRQVPLPQGPSARTLRRWEEEEPTGRWHELGRYAASGTLGTILFVYAAIVIGLVHQGYPRPPASIPFVAAYIVATRTIELCAFVARA